MAGSEHYSLKWNNYQSTMTSVFHHLLRTEAFVDVTLACDDESLKAHKVVLSACSSYFQKILLNNPSQHPTIIMPSNVCFTDLKFIIEFVYRGEIDVSQAELTSLLNTANQLKIKGLCEPPEGANMKDMPGAEVTPIPPPARHSSPVPLAMVSRAGKIKRLVIQKRRLDRRRLYKENLQHQKQDIHSEEIEMQHVQQQPQTIHQAQQTIHQQQNVHQAQQNLNQQQQQSMHQQQQTMHQHQAQQQTMHQHQSQQSMHQTHHHQTQQQMLHQTQQIQHAYTQQEPQLIQTVVTSMHDPHSPHSQITSDALANCITVATSTDDDLKNDVQRVVILEGRVGHNGHLMMTSPPPIMTTHAIPSSQQVLLDSSGLSVHSDMDSLTAEVSTQNTSPDHSLMSSPPHHEMTVMTSVEGRVTVETSPMSPQDDAVKVKYETLRAMDQSDPLDLEAQLSAERENGQLQCGSVEEVETKHTMHTMMITPELIGLIPSSSSSQQESVSESIKREAAAAGVNKTWSQEDMDAALDALRNHTMSLTKASTTYGIPSTTLWQRAHRLGIDTPKKDGPAKSWTEDNLNVALDALRNGSISANKASKAYGIPSSTLYKIARREGIRLAAPFNAAPTTWSPEDLERALEAIRSGQTTVQRAAADYGIPSGTLYGRCKREGIELSRSNPTPWSEDAMTEALEAVRQGQMSINQAAIHYNLPYSSLYGRFKRVKYEADHPSEQEEIPIQTHNISAPIMLLQYQQPTIYQHTPS